MCVGILWCECVMCLSGESVYLVSFFGFIFCFRGRRGVDAFSGRFFIIYL